MADDAEAKRVARLAARYNRQDENMINDAVRANMGHANGRKFLWWLLQIGKVGTQPFATNALSTSFACGELNVGNQVLEKLLSVNSAGYVQMLEERAHEHTARYGSPDDGDANSGDDGDTDD